MTSGVLRPLWLSGVVFGQPLHTDVDDLLSPLFAFDVKFEM